MAEPTLDDILAGYDKPAEVVPTTGVNTSGEQPTYTADPVEVIPGENARAKGVTITHNPAGSDPQTEYYVRGPKKGQPKPPKKGDKKQAPKPTSIQASTLMTGAMCITMIDLILPMALVALHNWQFPKAKIDIKDLKMKPDQKNDLAPIADAVARELNINASPTVLLLIGLIGIYSMNMMILHNEAVAKQKIDEKAKKDASKTDHQNGIRNIPTSPN